MQIYFDTQPDRIMYRPVRNGADVWLRRNIRQLEMDDESCWVADEVYIHTDDSFDTIATNFDNYFMQRSDVQPSTAERLDALEAGLAELAEVMLNG